MHRRDRLVLAMPCNTHDITIHYSYSFSAAASPSLSPSLSQPGSLHTDCLRGVAPEDRTAPSPCCCPTPATCSRLIAKSRRACCKSAAPEAPSSAAPSSTRPRYVCRTTRCSLCSTLPPPAGDCSCMKSCTATHEAEACTAAPLPRPPPAEPHTTPWRPPTSPSSFGSG